MVEKTLQNRHRSVVELSSHDVLSVDWAGCGQQRMADCLGLLLRESLWLQLHRGFGAGREHLQSALSLSMARPFGLTGLVGNLHVCLQKLLQSEGGGQSEPDLFLKRCGCERVTIGLLQGGFCPESKVPTKFEASCSPPGQRRRAEREARQRWRRKERELEHAYSRNTRILSRLVDLRCSSHHTDPKAAASLT